MSQKIKFIELPKEAAGYAAGCNIDLEIGQKLYTEDQMREYAKAVAEANRVAGFHEAVKLEREACAVIAENFSTRDGYEIAHKIRARSNQS